MKKALGLSSLALCGVAVLGACGGKVIFETGSGGQGGTGSTQVTTSGKGTSQVSTGKGSTVAQQGSTTGVSTTVGNTTDVGPTTTGVSVGQVSSVGSGQQCQATCAMAHPTGFAFLSEAIVQSCACQPNSPCSMECSGSPVCALPPGAPNATCGGCIQTQAAMGAASACALEAATGVVCQSNPDCSALVQCILGC